MQKLKLPNYTQIPNQFIEVMHKYSHTTKAIFIAICRKTIGWHKLSDRISYSQIMQMTGVSKGIIRPSINTLIRDGWIVQTRTNQGYVYDLNIEFNTPKRVQQDNKGNNGCDSTVPTVDTTKERKEIYINIEHTFLKKFKQETGEEYRINYAKDRRLMKPLIKKYGENKIIMLIDLWFRDDFGEKCGYTIGGFSSCFNKLLLRSNSGEKTREKNTNKLLTDIEAARQDKKLHPEKYRLPNSATNSGGKI